MSVCLFPNSSKKANPNELKFSEMISVGVQIVLGKKTIAFAQLFTGKESVR